MLKYKGRDAATRLKDDSGSAVVEFVALAIPLFIPIFIYLNQFSSVSANEEIARTLSREVLRVYVISESDTKAQELSVVAMRIMAQKMQLKDSEIESMRIHTDCSLWPCLSANGRIRLTITFNDARTGRLVSAAAQEYLSPWL